MKQCKLLIINLCFVTCSPVANETAPRMDITSTIISQSTTSMMSTSMMPTVIHSEIMASDETTTSYTNRDNETTTITNQMQITTITANQTSLITDAVNNRAEKDIIVNKHHSIGIIIIAVLLTVFVSLTIVILNVIKYNRRRGHYAPVCKFEPAELRETNDGSSVNFISISELCTEEEEFL